jgi:hypothetical protein
VILMSPVVGLARQPEMVADLPKTAGRCA